MIKKIILLCFVLFLAFNVVQRMQSYQVKSETKISPTTAITPQPPFPDAYNLPPRNWTGNVFKLSQKYPTVPPPPENYPWKAIRFKTEPVKYLKAVLRYGLEGNLEVDFQVEKNPIRKWYHAPYMHIGDRNKGREFIRGLTRELTSVPKKLHDNQTVPVENWAVAIYNAPGGYTIGRVWANHTAPNPRAAIFPEGTVAIKFLFTQADKTLVPYLANSLEWKADILRVTETGRQPVKLRLLQIDVAVRDSEANATTGWVFGTFIYNANRRGNTVWARMVPIGLMYGNDPEKFPFSTDKNFIETVYNPNLVAEIPAGYNPFQGFGYNPSEGSKGRLNGPVDNPKSSCLSCHSTSQIPDTVPAIAPMGQEKEYFRNIPAGQPFSSPNISLDYALQLQVGLGNFAKEKRLKENNFTLLPRFFPIERDGTIIRDLIFVK